MFSQTLAMRPWGQKTETNVNSLLTNNLSAFGESNLGRFHLELPILATQNADYLVSSVIQHRHQPQKKQGITTVNWAFTPHRELVVLHSMEPAQFVDFAQGVATVELIEVMVKAYREVAE